MLTSHLIVKNHQATIEAAIQSLLPLGGNIIAIDIGSDDETPQICKRYGASVKKVAWEQHYGQVRTIAQVDGWNFLLEPWEKLHAGHDVVLSCLESVGKYAVQRLENGILTKSVRLWHGKHKFSVPVCGELPLSGSQLINALIISENQTPADFEQVVSNWQESAPLNPEPQYYAALRLLRAGNYQQFIVAANQSVFMGLRGTKLIMLLYQMSLVEIYVLNNIPAAISRLAQCIAVNPTLAELWCLLGDAHYKLGAYGKAITFYENGMLLGSQRQNLDPYPLEISKYKEYPQAMLKSCQEMIASSAT